MPDSQEDKNTTSGKSGKSKPPVASEQEGSSKPSAHQVIPKTVSFTTGRGPLFSPSKRSSDENKTAGERTVAPSGFNETERTSTIINYTKSVASERSARLTALFGEMLENSGGMKPAGQFQQKVRKLQHEGKIKTVGRGLERDMVKLIFRGDLTTQGKRKEELQNEIEHMTNRLRKVNVVLDHLRKKREVETMKVRVKMEKKLKQATETARVNRDKSVADLVADSDMLQNIRDKRAGEEQRAEKVVEDLREDTKRLNIYLVSFYRSLFGFQDTDMTSKKFKNTFINIYDQFIRGNVQDPLIEFMRKEQLLKRIHSSSCKRVGAFRSKSTMPAQNRLDFHSSLYFSIIELQNETSKLTSEKVKKLKGQRAQLVQDYRVVSNHYYRAMDLLEQRNVDTEKYKTDLPF